MVEQVGEEFLPAGLAMCCGVVVLGLQGAGRNWMVVWKKVQVSQINSKVQSRVSGRVQ